MNAVDYATAVRQLYQGQVQQLCVDETSYEENKSGWLEILDKGLADDMIFWIEHPFHFSKEEWKELDAHCHGRKVKILVNGVLPPMQNIQCFDLAYQEHVMSHHVCIMLSHMLEQKRKPTMDFIAMFGRKDEYRKRITDRLSQSPLMENSILQNFTHGKRREDIKTDFQQEYENFPFVSGLGAFGNGFPNMKWYERAWCEVVTEVSNTEIFHMTEKVWRPILLKVPVVLLTHKSLYDKMLRDGYRFYDNGGFYATWHTDSASWSHKLDALEGFLKHLKELPDRTPVDAIAEYNHNHFWNVRKNTFYTKSYEAMKNCFGPGVFDEIYSRLDT